MRKRKPLDLELWRMVCLDYYDDSDTMNFNQMMRLRAAYDKGVRDAETRKAQKLYRVYCKRHREGYLA